MQKLNIHALKVDRDQISQAFADDMKSSNEYQACSARILSKLMPMMLTQLEAERQRGTDMNMLINIAPGLVTSLLLQILPPFKFEQSEEMVIQVGKELISAYSQASMQYLKMIEEHS